MNRLVRLHRSFVPLPFYRRWTPRRLYSIDGHSEPAKTDKKPDAESLKAQPKPSASDPAVVVEETEKYRELHNAYLMALADMENLRVRTRKEVEAAANHSISRFAKDLLSVLDVLELALKNSEIKTGDFQKAFGDLREGVDMTKNELVSIFKRHGIELIETKAGDAFDPNTHTAIFQIPKSAQHPVNSIVEVQKKGYRIKDRILRHAHVGVSSSS